jgi:hypothetical protein
MAYDANPLMSETVLGLDEVVALEQEQGRSVARDQRKLAHLLHRMAITLQVAAEQRRGLNSQIQTLQMRQEQTGYATTLDPRDAVRFLSKDQLTELVEGHLKERVAAVERMAADVSRTRQLQNQELARLQFAIAGIEEDPSIPAEVRERFARLRTHVPADVPANQSSAAPSSPTGEDLTDLFSAA